MAKFRKKPVVIEAIRCREAHHLMGSNWAALPQWFKDAYEGKNNANVKTIIGRNHSAAIDIVTLEGTMQADLDDWIIRGVKGELYPCKSDIFEATYEPASAAMTEWQQIVTPVNDIRPHIDSEHCPCQPQIADGVLTHNAFDGRDRAERYDEAMGTQGRFASIVDCVQIGQIILEPPDESPLTFMSTLTNTDDGMRFEVGNSNCMYRVTLKIEEI